MEVKTIAQRVRELMAHLFGVDVSAVTDDVKPMAKLGADSLELIDLIMLVEDEFDAMAKLGADSLELIDLIMLLEDEFDVIITDEEVPDGPVLTVGEWIQMVEKKVEAKNAPH